MANAMKPNEKLGAGDTHSLTDTAPVLGDRRFAGHLVHSVEPGTSW